MGDMAKMPLDELATEVRAIAERAFNQNDMIRGMVLNIFALRFEQCHAQIVIATDALEILSKLGNEPHDGNSDGNRIAQAALKAIRESHGGD